MAGFENTDIKIVWLADYPEFITSVSEWLHTEFGRYHQNSTIEKRTKRLKKSCNKTKIPITLLVLHKGMPIGTASLIENDMESHPNYSPWLASVYTLSEYRNNGVAKSLIKHIITLAARLNYEQIYLFTDKYANYYGNFGWLPISNEMYHGESVTLMRLLIR
ncbi:MAG: GNAT family N-acetyltransferase [Spirochaetales bacterium]|nr:GNAT family N-acetyltransferase [Spirochaetales bacterium]